MPSKVLSKLERHHGARIFDVGRTRAEWTNVKLDLWSRGAESVAVRTTANTKRAKAKSKRDDAYAALLELSGVISRAPTS